MWQPSNRQWWCLAIVAVVVVAAWPPDTGRSLAMSVVNWAVDPFDALPVLPPQLGPGTGDDVEAVNARDAVVRSYDQLYMEGGWTRQRLRLKVARDPLPPSTTRQLLVVLAVVTALLVWRSSIRREE
ncbi:MAG: hypothetical protein R2712_17270 [Vicinamibacterales bacterium]